MRSSAPNQKSGQARGFSLTELLVVLAVVTILAALVLPALSRRNTGILCLSNLRQFNMAWLMYAQDSDDRVPSNNGSDNDPDPVTDTWVRGWLDIARPNWPDNTKTQYVRMSLLAPYLGQSVDVWRCPADHSQGALYGQMLPRVRSYSMNSYLGSHEDSRSPWKYVRKTLDMMYPSPAQTFVFIDEREDSIDDCFFVVDMFNGPASLVAVPRNAHNGRGTLSFADGHAELHRWIDPRTEPPIIPLQFVTVYWTPGPPNADVLWLREHTTGPK